MSTQPEAKACGEIQAGIAANESGGGGQAVWTGASESCEGFIENFSGLLAYHLCRG